APGDRRSNLPGGWDEGRELVFSAVAARLTVRVVRCGHAHGAGARRPDDWVDAADLGLADHFHDRWIRAVRLAAAMVSGNAKANARHGERFATSSIASTGPNRVVAAQARFHGSAAGLFLLRLLLVSALHLDAGLSFESAGS